VVAAWQPIAAPSYGDSLLNIGQHHRMVGKNNAIPGVAPTWVGPTGWAFNGSTQWLNSQIVATNSYSAIVRFTGSAQAK
jgi:hypothetical protein